MYKLPEDVVKKIEKIYPEIDVTKLVHVLMESIIEKTLQDGNCTIRELGKFTSYVAESSRVGRDIVRFKFKVSQAFTNKIRYDEFLLENLKKEAAAEFTEAHERNCKGKREKRHLNIIAQSNAAKHSKQMTQENVAREEILKIIDQ